MISEKSQSIMKLINLLNCYNVRGGRMNNDNVKWVRGHEAYQTNEKIKVEKW